MDTLNDTKINQISRDELEKIQNTWDLPKSLKASKDICSEDLLGESKNSGSSLLGNSTNDTTAALSTHKNDKNSDSLLGKRKIFQVETVKTEASQDK